MSDKDVLIRVGLCKKVGLPNYGSFGADMAMEINVDLGILADPDRFSGLIKSAYQQCMDHITQQIKANTGPAPAGNLLPPSVHVPEPSQPPATAYAAPPQPAGNGSSEFGKWLVGQAQQYGMPLPLLTGQLYAMVYPNATITDYVAQGKEMASLWQSFGDKATQYFNNYLDEVFDKMDGA